MTTLLILFILVGLALYGVQEYYQVKLNSKPTRTPANAIAVLASMLENDENDEQQGGRILDLGSGYGDLVLGLARMLPTWQVDGVEQNPTPWIISNIRSIGKEFANYRFFIGDASNWPLRGYNVVFLNQNAITLKLWEAHIVRRLPVGCLLVCYNTQFPRIRPANTIKIDEKSTFYVYQRRAKEDGPTDETVSDVHTAPTAVESPTPMTEQPVIQQPVARKTRVAA